MKKGLCRVIWLVACAVLLAGCTVTTNGVDEDQPVATMTSLAANSTPMPTQTPRPEKTPDLMEPMPAAPLEGPFAWGDMSAIPQHISLKEADEWLGTHKHTELYIEGGSNDVVATLTYSNSTLILRNFVSDISLEDIENYLSGYGTYEHAPIPEQWQDAPMWIDHFAVWQSQITPAVVLPRHLSLSSTKEAVLAAFPQMESQYPEEPNRLYGLADIYPGTQNEWAENVGGWHLSAEDVYLYEPMDAMDIESVLNYIAIASNQVPTEYEVRRYVDFSMYFYGNTMLAASLMYYMD